MNYVVGIDLGGSSVKAIAATPGGSLLARHHETFDPARPMHFAETIRELLGRMRAERHAEPAHVGLSAPGLAAADGRSIAFLPERLPGIEGLVWADYLGLDRPVPVLNDAHAALEGEVWLGGARGVRNVAMLTLGTGVGGAAMVDGRLLKGAIGRAGHLGHVCLDLDGPPDICNVPGSLEYLVGNATIRERSGGRFATTHELLQACALGEAGAQTVWLHSVRALAGALTSFINVLDPEVILIGGGIAQAGDALFRPLTEFLDPIEWRPGGHRVRVAPAQLGDLAGAFGSAANALREGGAL